MVLVAAMHACVEMLLPNLWACMQAEGPRQCYGCLMRRLAATMSSNVVKQSCGADIALGRGAKSSSVVALAECSGRGAGGAA